MAWNVLCHFLSSVVEFQSKSSELFFSYLFSFSPPESFPERLSSPSWYFTSSETPLVVGQHGKNVAKLCHLQSAISVRDYSYYIEGSPSPFYIIYWLWWARTFRVPHYLTFVISLLQRSYYSFTCYSFLQKAGVKSQTSKRWVYWTYCLRTNYIFVIINLKRSKCMHMEWEVRGG